MHYIGSRVDSSTDESDVDTVHHQLVERYIRESFFVPQPDRTPSSGDGNEDFNNDIANGPARFTVLFSDNLVLKEIRSAISIPMSITDEDNFCFDNRLAANQGCSGSHKHGHKSHSLPPPRGVVVLDGSPLFPQDGDGDDDDRTIDTKYEDKNIDDKLYHYDKTLGMMIQRTFSFDDHLPIIHHRTKSFCNNDSSDEDNYIEERLSFAIPITPSNDRSWSTF